MCERGKNGAEQQLQLEELKDAILKRRDWVKYMRGENGGYSVGSPSRGYPLTSTALGRSKVVHGEQNS